MKEVELLSRTFNFGVRVIKFLRTLPENHELRVIKNQLIKASTSIGANYEEAQAGSSKADFIHKVKIFLKEARECRYWLRMLIALGYGSRKVEILLQESKELKNIFAVIVLRASEAM